MHYTPNIEMAFNSVEHIMRDVNYGWLIRYTHANVASFFFIFLYLHMAKGLYYGSYMRPRVMLWSIGVIIFVLTMATGFLGYTLPWGQMSLWGELKCLTCLFNKEILKFSYLARQGGNNFNDISIMIMPLLTTGKNKIKGIKRIGPHDISIYSIIFGSLLGDAHAEKRKKGVGTRISFYQESTHVTYLL